MTNTEIRLELIRQHRQDLRGSSRQECARLPIEKSKRILLDYVDYLEQELSSNNQSIDIGSTQETLLELSCIIRSGRARITSREYSGILRRLVGIYADGFADGQSDAFVITAADYAEVIEAISRAQPGNDYSEAVGQLLYYMGRLFSSRKGSWKTVYEHLLSMPDSIESVQMLKSGYFLEIQRWAEAGAGNLFSIRRDLNQRIATLEDELAEFDWCAGKEVKAAQTGVRGKVVSLEARRRQKEIDTILEQKERLEDEKRHKQALRNLVDSNIAEFETKLKQTRRAYFVRLVYSGTR